jgi:hypothetical protein
LLKDDEDIRILHQLYRVIVSSALFPVATDTKIINGANAFFQLSPSKRVGKIVVNGMGGGWNRKGDPLTRRE